MRWGYIRIGSPLNCACPGYCPLSASVRSRISMPRTCATGGAGLSGGADLSGGMDLSGGADLSGGTDFSGGTEPSPAVQGNIGTWIGKVGSGLPTYPGFVEIISP
jgi:hypothetical protein